MKYNSKVQHFDLTMRLLVCSLFGIGLAAAQPLQTSLISGKYFAIQFSVVSDTGGRITSAGNFFGTLVFNGSGKFTFAPNQGTSSGSGIYSLDSTGVLQMTSLMNNSFTINARYSPLALVGSTTEMPLGTPEGTTDVFLAIPAPSTPPPFSGNWFATDLEFDGASASTLHSSFVPWSADSTGALNADGTGVISLGSDPPRNFFLSADGNLMLGAPLPGSNGIFVAVKGAAGSALNGRFWTAGIRFDSIAGFSAYTGSASGRNTSATLTRRYCSPTGDIDFTGVNAISVNADATGTTELNTLGLGAAGNAFVTTEASPLDPGSFELNVAVRMPDAGGTGVYINALGILNGGSFAPAGNPVAPGEFVTLFGSGFGPAKPLAAPYPLFADDLQVTVNGLPAPLAFISPTQLNILVPFDQGFADTAAFQVNYKGQESNIVTVPLAATSPGIFSQDSSGSGPGTVLHADYTLVTPAHPATRGETLLIYLTGLGAVEPPVDDGTAPKGLSMAVDTPLVFMGGVPAVVDFAGLAPGFPGLYQINAEVPSGISTTAHSVPLAIQTSNAFHDQVDLPIF